MSTVSMCLLDGTGEGGDEGICVGRKVGFTVGAGEGCGVGAVGCAEGAGVGETVGRAEGIGVGAKLTDATPIKIASLKAPRSPM